MVIIMKRKSTALPYLALFGYGLILPILGAVLPAVAASYSLSLIRAGGLLSFHFIGFVFFILAGGALSSRWEKQTLLSGALLLGTSGLIMFALTRNIFLAHLAVFMIGGSGGLIESHASAMLADARPENSAAVLNMGQAAICIGATLTPLMIRLLWLWGLSFRLAYSVLGILLAGLFLFSIFVEVPRTNLPKETAVHASKSFFGDRYFWLVLITIFLYAGTEAGTWGYMSTFFEEKLGHESLLLLSCFFAAMAIGRLISGKLMEKFSLRSLIILFSVLSSLSAAGAAFANTMAWAVPLTFLTGICFSGLYPLIMSMGAQRSRSSTALSAIVLSGGLGTVGIPFAIVIVGGWLGNTPAQLSTSAYLLAIALIYMLGRKGWDLHKNYL